MKLFALLFLISFSLCAQQPTREQVRQIAVNKKIVKKMKGKPFPDFSFSARDGNSYTNESTVGKFVLFNFWFTRCRPCIEEMPELNDLVEEFEDQEVVFIAPTFDDDSQVERFLGRFEFDYQIVADVKDFCQQLSITSYPTHIIVDREGIVKKVIIGYSSFTVGELRRSLTKMLSSE